MKLRRTAADENEKTHPGYAVMFFTAPLPCPGNYPGCRKTSYQDTLALILSKG